MNILVSYNWLKEYLPGLKATPTEIAEKLSLHAFSVERWHRMDDGLDPSPREGRDGPAIVVGKILKIEAHPNADKLRIAYVQSGSQSTAHSSQPLKIVCGGTNLYEGQLVAVALPGAKVRWHGEGELVELKPTEIRGVKSEGMICAANEIGLETLTLPPSGGLSHPRGEGKSEREILDLTSTGAKVGVSVAKALKLDDTVMEVEITTNRPDAMGIIGLAREVGAIFNVPLKMKNEELRMKNVGKGGLDVKVEVPKLCPRYIGIVMEGIKVGPSPWWLQQRLIASGVRPINNLVDITNYVLLEYGQPCHVFDADKLAKEQIVVRMGKKGEKILALDGKTYGLDEKILVIADAERPVAIAGIMGGEKTGVTSNTTGVVFEIANFDPIVVRKGEHQLALTSDSSIRFNKGLPVELPAHAAARLVELAREMTGGEVVQIVDRKAPSPGLRPSSPAGRGKGVRVSPTDIQKLIGVDIPLPQMKKYLTALGFKVAGSAKKWSVTFPYWREVEADGTADIAEEVARMYGYHKLPSVLPSGAPPAESPNPQFVYEQKIKELAKGAGLIEVYTYSFVSVQDLNRAGFEASQALALANPLSSEITHMRPWLGISMLKALEQNQKSGKTLNMFELSAEYHPQIGTLPEERQKLIVAYAGKEEHSGDHFYAIKGMAEHLAKNLALPEFHFEKVGSTVAPWVTRFHPSRVLLCKSGRDILGVVGELHPSLLKAYGIEHRVAILEWEMKAVYPLVGNGRRYSAPLVYPPVKRDISFFVGKEIEYAALIAAIKSVDRLVFHAELFDRYEGKGVPEGNINLAFHISYADPSRTLTAEEADKAHAKLVAMLEKQFGAKIRA